MKRNLNDYLRMFPDLLKEVQEECNDTPVLWKHPDFNKLGRIILSVLAVVSESLRDDDELDDGDPTREEINDLLSNLILCIYHMGYKQGKLESKS